MAFDPHANLALSLITTAPSPPTTGTTLTVSAGQGGWFQAPPFNATVWPANVIPTPANAEIVRVTARTTDTMTIVRAQEGTTARAIAAGDQIAASITAKTLTDVETEFATVARVNVMNTFTAAQMISTAGAGLFLNDTAQAANSRVLYITNNAQVLALVAVDDALGYQSSAVSMTRTGDIKATRDLYEKARTTAVGHWITLTPTLGTDSGSAVINSNFGSRYMLSGKTLTVLFFWQITITGSPTTVRLTLPAGLMVADYAIVPFGRGATTGVIRCNPGTTTMDLQIDLNYTPWTAGAIYVGGTVTVAIQ